MSTVKNIKIIALAGLIAVGLIGQAAPAHEGKFDTLTNTGGCFWCVEAV